MEHKGEFIVTDKAYTGPGKIFNSDFLDGLKAPTESVIKAIEILEKKKEWESWDLDKEFNPNYYREKGYLDVEERPAFRKIVDAS